MGAEFTSVFKRFIRVPGLLVWSLLFPCILGTMFCVMFSGLDEIGIAANIPVVVVADDGWGSEAAETLRSVVANLTEPGTGTEDGEPLLTVREVPTLAEAEDLVEAGDALCAISFRGGEPRLSMQMSTGTDANDTTRIREMVVKTVVDSTLQIDAAIDGSVADLQNRVEDLVAKARQGDQSALDQALRLQDSASAIEDHARRAGETGHVREVSLTKNEPDQTVRYYYALFGMAVLLTANVGLVAIVNVRAGASPVGARRNVGGIGRVRLAIAALLAAWILAFACLAIGYAYIGLVLRIDLGADPLAFLGALLLGAALATALGGVIGAIPGLSEKTRAGICTAVACVGALFAGLYGTPCMEFADLVSRVAPWMSYVNPAKAISDALFSLYNYDMLGPYWQSLAALATFTAACLAIMAALMRRNRLAHL